MALGYNDRQRLLGLPENENADLDNLVGVPAQPEREFAQSTALENSGSVAPINEESDIPVQTRVPAATDVSAQVKTRSDSSSQAQFNPQSGEAPDLMTQYRKLMDQRKTELEGARKAEMLQNMLSGINSNVGLIIGGNAAKNSGAAVTAPKLGDLAKTDYSGNVDQEMKPELEGLMEQYKLLQQDKQAAANRRIQEEQLNIAREGLDIKRLLADKKASAAGLTEGQKSVDRDFGKRYNEWTTQGRSSVEANLGKLQQAMSQLEKRKNEGDDRIIGRLPDVLNPFEEDIQLRELVRSAAQETLRATLGPQFTEKEGEAIMKRAYDPTLSPKSNMERIQAVVTELKGRRDEMDRRTGYFGDMGTLRGIENGGTTPAGENSEAPLTKTIGQDTYIKVPGGWQKVK